MDYVINICEQIFDLVNEMSPYLLLGFLIAGLLHAFVPNSIYSKYLSGNSFRSVINAAIFGIPLPLCSCGVIPTAMSLRKEGASKGATVSFLIATPQTGVDSIFATYSLMGLPFAIVRPIVALITAVLGGQFVNALDKDEEKQDSSANVKNERCRDFSEKEVSFVAKLQEAFKFGFIEMMEDIGKWLVIGLVVAGIITVLVPDSFFAVFKDNTLMSMLLVLCISIPMYLCATGSIPIAVALMMKGLTPGAALVLLMAGPASNAASILVINKVMGKKTLILYLVAIVVGAIASGVVIDTLLPREWFTSISMKSHDCCHEESSIFSIICTIVLSCLLLNVLRMKLTHKSACSCGHSHSSCAEESEHSCCCGHDHSGCSHEHIDEETCDASCDDSASNVTIYHIKGMNCNHCRTNTEKAIISVQGVEEVSVDLHSGEAVVKGDSFDKNEIIKAVESLGFEIS